MSKLKPFIRMIILSMILTYLLIYLGLRYHWGDLLKPATMSKVTLTIPQQVEKSKDNNIPQAVTPEIYSPEIIINDNGSTLLESMNKDQIAEQCVNLLSKELKDPLTLELATVNCVVSNYQEIFQNIKETDKKSGVSAQNKLQLNQQCKNQFNQSNQYSKIEKELLIGICVSDRLSNKS